jgi:dienelactone hydrolase
MMESNTLFDGFTKETFSALGKTRDVYRSGSGPAVVVLSEMPGITPSLLTFARTLTSHGMSVAIPHLFGRDGEPGSNKAFFRTFREVCVSREFTLFATGSSSRITKWLNELARHEHQRCGGPGVGVIGMCLTGGFALALMVDPVVVAPVLSQPSLPIGRSEKKRRDLGISAEEQAAVVARAANGTCVMGARFSNDKLSPADRFANLRAVLGDAFIGIEIDSSEGNAGGYPIDAHSVFTDGQDGKEGSPTTLAMNQLLEFFASRLTS